MKLTFSRVHLADAGCLAWAHPAGGVTHSHSTSDAAALGTAIHAAIEDVIRTREVRQYEDDAVSKHIKAWVLDWWQLNQHLAWTPEVCVAVDPVARKAIVGKPAHHRDYSWVPEGWISGTLDAVLFDDPTVLDWKTGYSSLGAPADSAQLQSGALAISYITGARSVQAGLVAVHSDSCEVDSTVLRAWDLAERRERLREHLAVLRDPTPPKPQPGGHCVYCPGFGGCQATTGMLATVADGSEKFAELVELPKQPGEITSKEDAVKLARFLKVAEAELDRLQSVITDHRHALEAWIDAHAPGKRLEVAEDGSWYGKVVQSKRSVCDLDKRAVEIVRGCMGDDSAVSVSMSTSISALNAVDRGRAEECLKALEAAGYVKNQPRSFFKWQQGKRKVA